MKIVRTLANTRCNDKCDYGCPAVFVLDNGDVAFIGKKSTPEIEASIPPDAGIGAGEALVTVPRELLIAAGWALPVPVGSVAAAQS